MIKANIWKIGTKIEYYIDEFIEYLSDYNLTIDSTFFVVLNKKADKVQFTFGNNDDFEILQLTKAQQLLKILLALDFIEPSGIERFSNDKDLLTSVNYLVKSDRKNWRENFIAKLSDFTYLDSFDEEGKDLNDFLFSQHKNALYSILKAFKIYDSNEMDIYTNEEKKALHYWVITELFKPFDNELRNEAGRLLNEIAEIPKPLSDMSQIKWKEMKIENISAIKKGDLESDLWNLADILSSKNDISIPIMQRNYVWSTELVDKLIDDITSLDDEKQFHYIGSIVYKIKKNNFRILDGQQRLTTMFLILRAIDYLYSSKYWTGEVPSYLKTLFKHHNPTNKEKLLSKRFIRLHGNEDYENFTNILADKEINEINNSIMWVNYRYIVEKIKNIIDKSKNKQEELDSIFRNTIERVAFTANKNQIENEYEIFEKLNTLSEPLTQIDLLKNYLLPFCIPEELDENESDVQSEFHNNIWSKLKTEVQVKRFVNYFIALYGDEYLSNKKGMKSFKKLSEIIRKKYNLALAKTEINEFMSVLRKIGQEAADFKSITDKSEYTKSDNTYYSYSDILSSFDKRYVYAPLIKTIFDLFYAKKHNTDRQSSKIELNKIRKILFELERYELFFQVVLYRGQSITLIIERIIKEVKNLHSENNFNNKTFRNIFSDKNTMSPALVAPEIETFKKKISNEPIADKVSTLILNRLRFYVGNNNNIELDTSFNFHYLKKPSREHILSQDIKNYDQRKKIFSISKETRMSGIYSEEEFNRLHKTYIDMIGNILIVEQSDNSEFNNKSSKEKAKLYRKKPYLEKDPAYCGLAMNKKENRLSLKNYLDNEELGFDKIKDRSEAISEKLAEIYE